MKCSYYAVFEYADDGINITFPDVNTLSCADDTEEGLYMAQEALGLGLDGIPLDIIPVPSKLEDLRLNDNQKAFLITAEMEINDGKLLCPGVKTVADWKKVEDWLNSTPEHG